MTDVDSTISFFSRLVMNDILPGTRHPLAGHGHSAPTDCMFSSCPCSIPSVAVLQATQVVHDLVMISQELEHIIRHGFAGICNNNGLPLLNPTAPPPYKSRGISAPKMAEPVGGLIINKPSRLTRTKGGPSIPASSAVQPTSLCSIGLHATSRVSTLHYRRRESLLRCKFNASLPNPLTPFLFPPPVSILGSTSRECSIANPTWT